MNNEIKIKREILMEKFIQINANASKMMNSCPSLRWGQAIYNSAQTLVPECIGIVIDEEHRVEIPNDCFYDDTMVDAFLNGILKRINEYK